MSQIKDGQNGFTVVEIVVTIAVAAVILLSLNTALNAFLHLGQRGRYLSLESSFVEAEVETLRNNGYNSIGIGTTSLTSQMPSALPPSRTGTLVVTQPQAGIKQVDITVTYIDQKATQSFAYTTYIGEIGVGQ